MKRTRGTTKTTTATNNKQTIAPIERIHTDPKKGDVCFPLHNKTNANYFVYHNLVKTSTAGPAMSSKKIIITLNVNGLSLYEHPSRSRSRGPFRKPVKKFVLP